MQAQRAKFIIAASIFATGAALAWRGVTVWRKPGKALNRGLSSLVSSRKIPAVSRDGRLVNLDKFEFDIQPANTSIDEAASALETALRERALAPPPGQPADVWRPRMLELAKRVPLRMRAIWHEDVDAIESIAREEGETEYPDISDVAPELRRTALSMANKWKGQWALAPISSNVWVRTSTYDGNLNSPFAPPTVSVRNALRPRLPDLPPRTPIHEVLIPVKVDVETSEGAVHGVIIGFAYYWSDKENRWNAFQTTVYHRDGGGRMFVGAPP